MVYMLPRLMINMKWLVSSLVLVTWLLMFPRVLAFIPYCSHSQAYSSSHTQTVSVIDPSIVTEAGLVTGEFVANKLDR